MRFQNKYIAEIRDGGEIANHSREANLRATLIINAKAQRMLDRSLHYFPGDSFCPIAVRQEAMNHIQIQTPAIGTDQKLAAPRLDFASKILSWIHPNILNGRGHSALSTSERRPQKRRQVPAIHVLVRSLAGRVMAARQHNDLMIEAMPLEFLDSLVR